MKKKPGRKPHHLASSAVSQPRHTRRASSQMSCVPFLCIRVHLYMYIAPPVHDPNGRDIGGPNDYAYGM